MSEIIIALLKIHINRYYKTALMFIGGLVVILLFAVSVQVYSNSQQIKFSIEPFAPLFALLAFLIFSRGKTGDGKFLSRLPVAKWHVYVTKLITGIVFYTFVIGVFLILAFVISGLLKIAGYQVAFNNMYNIDLLTKMLFVFVKGYLWYGFIVCLVLFLERWMSAREAIGLIILAPIVLMVIFPFIFKFLNFNIDFNAIDFSFLKAFADFVKMHKQVMLVVFYMTLTVLSGLLYRLRGFKSF